METLIPEVLDIDSLDLTALTVQTKGSVKVVNIKAIEKFEQDSQKVIKLINLDLVTDNDFAKAKASIKICKEAEAIIKTESKKALLSQEEIAKANTIIERVGESFRRARLSLEKSDKANTAKRKKEIVDNGIKDIADLLADSPVKHGFVPHNQSIHAAIVGKSSFFNMEDAVAVVVQIETERLQELEYVFATNMAEIELSEKNFPGIYPDKKQLALKYSDVVLPTLVAREEKFKNDARAVKEREEAEAKAKAELEDTARLEKEKQVEEAPATESKVDSFQEPEAPPLPPKNHHRGHLKSPPLPPSDTEQYRNHFFTVSIWGTSADAKKLAAEIGLQFQAKMVKVEVVCNKP